MQPLDDLHTKQTEELPKMSSRLHLSPFLSLDCIYVNSQFSVNFYLLVLLSVVKSDFSDNIFCISFFNGMVPTIFSMCLKNIQKIIVPFLKQNVLGNRKH